MQRSRRFLLGEVGVRLDVRQGRIEAAHLGGDFLGTAGIRRLEGVLRGVPYDPEALQLALGGLDLGPSFPGLSGGTLAELLGPDAP